jgi:hypothetical protein
MTEGTMEADVLKPKLLASTGAKFSCSINEFRAGETDLEGIDNGGEMAIQIADEEGGGTNYFKSMQWYTLFPLSSPFTTITKLFLISRSNIFSGHLTALVSSQTALITPFVLSSPQRISSPRTLPLSPLRRTPLYPHRNQSIHSRPTHSTLSKITPRRFSSPHHVISPSASPTLSFPPYSPPTL